MNKVERYYINSRIELYDHIYAPSKSSQYDNASKIYNRNLGPLTAMSAHRPDIYDLSLYGTSCYHTPTGLIVRDLLAKDAISDNAWMPLGGKGPRAQDALLGNLGEAGERLLGVLDASTRMGELVFGSFESLSNQGRVALGPDQISLFSEEQYHLPNFPFSPFTPSTLLWWIEGEEHPTGRRTLVPAQLILFSWNAKPGEARIGYATSGGLAFHPDPLHALTYGIWENIERDAINLRWYCRIPPLRVKVDLASRLTDLTSILNFRVSTPYIPTPTILLNTIDFPIPVFVAMTRDYLRPNRTLLAGGGTWGHRDRALLQAIFEIGQMRTGYKIFPAAGAQITAETDPSELSDFFYAPIFYGYPANYIKLEWYIESGQSIEWDQVPSLNQGSIVDYYEQTAKVLDEKGIKPIVFDFSRACWPGMHVVKVFMPQLTFAHVPNLPYFGHQRYYTTGLKLGTTDRTLGFSELNRDPLPFP